MADNTAPDFNITDLPTGLAEMIKAFIGGCGAKGKTVTPDVPQIMADRFYGIFELNEEYWGPSSQQVLTLARLAGRLAAAYASLDARADVEWTHARFALRDAQAECHMDLPVSMNVGARRFGKYCRDVDLETP